MREKLCRDTNHMVEKEWAGKRASLLRSFTSFLTCYVEFTFFYELRRIPPDKFFIMPSRPAKPSGELLLSKYELKCPKFVSRVVSFESRAKFERWLRAAGTTRRRRRPRPCSRFTSRQIPGQNLHSSRWTDKVGNS